MLTMNLNVYEAFGLEKPEGAAGQLRCYIQDVNRRIGSNRTFPAILVLPGGGYGWTSAREAETVAMRYYAQGFHAFILDYSCAPFIFPTALREAALAMRWIRQGEKTHGISGIAAVGFSAGGHLCATLGTLFDSDVIADCTGGYSVRPDALVLSYPVIVSWGDTHEGSFQNLTGGDLALRRRLSVERLVRPDMPPVFLWHTRDDPSVPVRNSILLAAALDDAGVSFAMHIYRHGPHGVSTADLMSNAADQLPEVSRDVPGWLDASVDFLRESGLTVKDNRG